MKTPDEIKKGLSCCGLECEVRTARCRAGCPYYPECDYGQVVVEDAISCIQQLEADNAQQARCIENLTDKLNAMIEEAARLKAERDAAVADMRQASIYLCCACKKYHHAVRDVSNHYCEEIGERPDFAGAMSCGMFEWRGVQKEEVNHA